LKISRAGLRPAHGGDDALADVGAALGAGVGTGFSMMENQYLLRGHES
jgi:hypothetical protein